MTEREDGPPVCTVAGLVLFGYRPRRLMRHAGIRWMAFKGDKKAYDALDDQVLDGPLIAHWRESSGSGREIAEKGLIELLADTIRPFVSEEAGEVDESMRRERRWHYPVEALHKAVVNALAHRDWTRYEEMEVVCYVDRLEVLSPGALNDSMTLEKMITGRRSARNPLIVNVLCDYGYATRIRGVRNKIIPLTQFRQTCEMCQKCAHNYFETYNVICDYRVSALRSTSRLLYPRAILKLSRSEVSCIGVLPDWRPTFFSGVFCVF